MLFVNLTYFSQYGNYKTTKCLERLHISKSKCNQLKMEQLDQIVLFKKHLHDTIITVYAFYNNFESISKQICPKFLTFPTRRENRSKFFLKQVYQSMRTNETMQDME